jgi:hypothetical protein
LTLKIPLNYPLLERNPNAGIPLHGVNNGDQQKRDDHGDYHYEGLWRILPHLRNELETLFKGKEINAIQGLHPVTENVGLRRILLIYLYYMWSLKIGGTRLIPK